MLSGSGPCRRRSALGGLWIYGAPGDTDDHSPLNSPAAGSAWVPGGRPDPEPVRLRYRRPVEFGVCIASRIDDVAHAVLAEELGYDHVWAADSQLLWSDCYATLALIADRTERIRIGTGVAVAGTRDVAVTAAAHATINRLAPGRVFCGIGTGNTAMRIMGRRPMNIASFDRFLGGLRDLLDGRPATVTAPDGSDVEIRHLMPDDGFVSFAPRIPVYVSAFGPRSLALAVRHGDGLVSSVRPDPEAVDRLRSRIEAIARAEGRDLTPDGFPITTLTTTCVLEPGEPVDSARVRERVGAFAIAALHYRYEQWREAGRPDIAAPFPGWDDYVEQLDRVDPSLLHQRIHQGHNCWVLPDEERFVTEELIRSSCLVGTAPELATRIGELEQAGLTGIMVLPPLAVRDDVLRELAHDVMPRVRASATPTPAGAP